jgi:hypothetical protein
MKRIAPRLALGVGILAAVCTGALAAENPVPATCTAVPAAPSPEAAAVGKALRDSIEAGPFYTIPAAARGVADCRVRYLPGGFVKLEYRFKGDGALRVKHDAMIEYTEQSADMTLGPGDDPQAILVRAEQAAFGPDGCGIDWSQPKEQPARDNPSVKETVFRGDVCNCQARIRRDAKGQAVGLVLRSAC